MTAQERRDELIRWFDAFGEGGSYTAAELVDLTCIYTGNGRYDRCFDDLKVLHNHGLVDRLPGRPARWWF